MIKILFIQDNLINESLAWCDLAGLLKVKGYTYDLLVQQEEPDFFTRIKDFAPDLLIIPSSVLNPTWSISMARSVKQILGRTLVLAAGTQPTFSPEIILNEGFDIILRGEAEYPVLELLEKIAGHQDITHIDNLWVKTRTGLHQNPFGLLTDLDTLPLPDRELYYKYPPIKNFPIKLFSSGRGCPGSCSYCFNPAIRALTGRENYTRKKPVKKIITEIHYLLSKAYPFTHVHFSDDLFTYEKKWVLEFCAEYKDLTRLPFTFNSKVDYLDEELIAAVSAAGCKSIALGIESGNELLRNKVMNKNVRDQDILKIGSLIKKNGMILTTFNMLNIPGESLHNIHETILLNQKLKTDVPRMTLYTPIPNTKLYSEYIQDHTSGAGRSPSPESLGIYHLFPYLVRNRVLFWLVRTFPFILRVPFLHKLLGFFRVIFEMKFFNISYLSAIRYFVHTGGPKNRTTVYSSLI